MNEPEFNIGECVTYWPGDHGMNMVVIDVHGATYGLIEPPEGKPLAQHFQATATGADILESDLFHERPPRIFKW